MPKRHHRRVWSTITGTMLLFAAAVVVAPSAAAEPGSYRLWAGETLQPGARLISPESRFFLLMRTDGNLVELDASGQVVWSSRTSRPGSVLQMQADGNAVVYAPGHIPVWQTGTTGSGAQTIEVQDDANLVLYAPGHVALWATGLTRSRPTTESPGTATPASPTGSENRRANGPSPEGHLSYIHCTIWGSDQDDILHGTSGDDVICGQGGNGKIDGGGGYDEIYGGPGDDELVGRDTVNTLTGAARVASSRGIGDRIWGDEGRDTIKSGKGEDEIEGGPGPDTIDGGDQSDRIAGDRFVPKVGDPDGNDDIETGMGNDAVQAGGGDDVVVDAGNTTLDVINGGSGNDAIIGLSGFSSQFDGGPGNDVLFPAPSRLSPLGNSVVGGTGNDIAILMNGQLDGFTRGAIGETVGIPAGKCQVTYPIAPDNYNKVSEVKFGCPVLGPINLQIGGDGKVSVGSDIYSKEASLNPAQWRNFVYDKAGQLQGDVCVCDQLLGVPVLQQDMVF